jgi:hypothetical protein
MVQDLYKISDQNHWEEKLKDTYGLKLEMAPEVHDGQWITRQICDILKPISPKLIRACGVIKIIVKDLGPNKSYYPNHGFFRESDYTVTLNSDIFYHPDMPDYFWGNKGEFVSRPAETLYHEWIHSLDAKMGNLSLKPDWLKLSGWSETYKPGLKRLEIKEKGAPEVIGEYYYDPKFGVTSNFTRFYARRNPWDDLADSGAYYLAPGMKDKVPPTKRAYFDKLFKHLI